MSDARTTTGPHGRGTNGGWIGLRLPNGDPLPIWLEQGLVGATAILLVLGLTTAVLMGARTTTSTHRVQLAVTPSHDEHAQRSAARLGAVEAESVARAPEPTPRHAPVPVTRPAAPDDHATPAPGPPPSNQPAATAPPTDPTTIAPAPDPAPAPPAPEPSPDPPEVTPPEPPDEPPIDVIDDPPLPDDDPADDPADDPEDEDPGREDPGGGALGPAVADVVAAVVDLVTVPAL